MLPADSFGTAIGVAIGIGVGIELTNSDSDSDPDCTPRRCLDSVASVIHEPLLSCLRSSAQRWLSFGPGDVQGCERDSEYQPSFQGRDREQPAQAMLALVRHAV
ncbi:MAG: hypothetical protein N838_02070 [Thiohalocapsa sp. PB-PSB1]|nr:MAG: hypothetical protein N838_06240 [Thiohalocapsa sp. PB-PSB1]QQO52353.1 MAG: hypothetical protein N838_02070 [Thiohalocapsa sp. PB-PSB1]